MTTHTKHRRLQGTAVSTKMQKTALVRVNRQVEHPKYHKMFTKSKTYKVHDPDAKVRDGDVIVFEECRPFSKDKRWRYVETISSKK